MKYFLFLNFAAHFFSYTFPVQIYVISPNFDIALFILSLYSSTFHTKGRKSNSRTSKKCQTRSLAMDLGIPQGERHY